MGSPSREHPDRGDSEHLENAPVGELSAKKEWQS